MVKKVLLGVTYRRIGGLMHEKLADIQNSFWNAYKNFLQTKDANHWCDEAGRILNRYRHDRHPYFAFCEATFFAWSELIGVIRVIADLENGDEKIDKEQ